MKKSLKNIKIKKYPEGGKVDYTKYPKLKKLGDVTLKSDTTFTRDKTGGGDIEYFSPKQDTIRYETGLNYPHPKLGTTGVVYNPNTNNNESIALDLLHGMNVDPVYKKHRDEVKNSILKNDSGRLNYFYNIDLKEGKAGDGKESWINNFVDGVIRSEVSDDTTGDYALERTENKHQTKYEAAKLKNYIKSTGEGYMLPEATVKPKTFSNGGTVSNKDPFVAAMENYWNSKNINSSKFKQLGFKSIDTSGRDYESIFRYANGGITKPDYSAIAGAVAPMMLGLIGGNQASKAGQAPRNNTGLGVASGAISGASSLAPLGPWGMAAGAVVGGVTSGIMANKNYKQEMKDWNQSNSNEIFNQNQMDYTNRINKDLAGLNFAKGGFIPDQDNPQWIFNTWTNKMANGGMAGLVPAELEKEENVLLPDGTTEQFNGASHSQGGIKTTLPENTMVFSDKLKLGKKTFADLAKKYSTKKYEKMLEDKNSTPLAKKTANKMMENSKKNLMSLFNVQEDMKAENFNTEFKKKFGGLIKKYADGGMLGPSTDINLKKHWLKKYMDDNNISSSNIFNYPDNEVNSAYEAYNNKNFNLNYGYTPNFITGENLIPKTGKLPSQVGTPIDNNQPTTMIPWKPINFVTGRGLPREPINPIQPYSKPTTPSQGATPESVMQPRTSPAFNGYPKPNWWDKNKSTVGTVGTELGKGILNNIGNLSYLFNEGKSYDKVTPRTITPDYINADAQINEAKQAGATGNYMLRNTFAGSPGALLSSLPQNAVQTGRTVAGIQNQVDNANAGISNQTKQFNSQVLTGADDRQAQNKGQSLSNYYSAITQLGENTNKQMLGYNMSKRDKEMLPILLKLYPELAKYIQ